MEGEQEVGKSETKCKAEVKSGQVESDTVLPRGPPSLFRMQCPHTPGQQNCSYLVCLHSPIGRTWSMTKPTVQHWGPPPPAANVNNMLQQPSSIRQRRPAGHPLILLFGQLLPWWSRVECRCFITEPLLHLLSALQLLPSCTEMTVDGGTQSHRQEDLMSAWSHHVEELRWLHSILIH